MSCGMSLSALRSGRSSGHVLDIELSTLSRKLDRLEAELGVAVFERNHAGIRVTSGGRNVLARVHRVLGDIEAMKVRLPHAARQNRSAGPVFCARVSAIMSAAVASSVKPGADWSNPRPAESSCDKPGYGYSLQIVWDPPSSTATGTAVPRSSFVRFPTDRLATFHSPGFMTRAALRSDASQRQCRTLCAISHQMRGFAARALMPPCPSDIPKHFVNMR